jgi:pimeloyl-[acyl-carrier protein] synthase
MAMPAKGGSSMIQGDALQADDPRFAPQLEGGREEVYAYYERFREAGRVARGGPSWIGGDDELVLMRFEDVSTWLRDPRLGKEWRNLLPPEAERPEPAPNSFGEVANNFMLFRDPPHHTRLRATSNMAFTPRHVGRMREPIEALAVRLAGELAGRDGPVDLIAEFAYPLPVLVIAGILGVPEEDHPRFRDWAAVVAAAIDLPASGLDDFVQRADSTTGELVDYFGWLVARRRQDPREDLISSLIAAESSEGRIDEKELVATLILLLVAGHETTVNLIGNGMLALMRHPEQWRLLVNDPGVAKNATEELLRYDSPVQMTTRLAFEDLEIAGTPIRRGTEVIFVMGSANRDPRAFEHPDRLDIRRDVGRIMSFGMGIHFCLGAPLARMEGEIAFRTLAMHAPGLMLATEHPKWRAGIVLRGLQELPVIVG